MAVSVIVVPLVRQTLQLQVLTVEPSAKVNQISLNQVPPCLKDTAVTFYEILTEKTLPVREPYMCTMSA